MHRGNYTKPHVASSTSTTISHDEIQGQHPDCRFLDASLHERHACVRPHLIEKNKPCRRKCTCTVDDRDGDSRVLPTAEVRKMFCHIIRRQICAVLDVRCLHVVYDWCSCQMFASRTGKCSHPCGLEWSTIKERRHCLDTPCQIRWTLSPRYKHRNSQMPTLKVNTVWNPRRARPWRSRCQFVDAQLLSNTNDTRLYYRDTGQNLLRLEVTPKYLLDGADIS